MSREVRIYKTFATGLLVVSSIFITATVCLGVYLFYHLHEIRLLRAQLLNTSQVQNELLKNSNANLVIYPHRIGSIAYVLNPFLKEGTLWAPEGSAYPINSLGLRGESIEPKASGVQRIVLLGDSWFFGWFLAEEEKTGSVLQQRLEEKLGTHPYEVITAAVPGWNTECETAFLENHLIRIDPDIIIWEMMANDVLDANGAAPPGVMAGFFSPQSPNLAPVNSLGKLNQIPMPFILSRMRRNLHFIETFLKKYPIPTIIMAIDIDPALMAFLNQDSDFPCPILYLPDKYKLDEKRGWIGPGDFHPTPWLNQIMAVGIMQELSSRNWIPPIAWVPSETDVIQEFTKYRAEQSTEAAVARYLAHYADWTPSEFTRDTISGDIAYGLVNRDKMCERGILYLHVPPNRHHIVLQFAMEESLLEYPRRISVTVRDLQGRETTAEHRIENSQNRLAIPVPLPRHEYLIHELEWAFDFRECHGPTLCYSAELLKVSSE